MSKTLNRHYAAVWKKKRKHHFGAKCRKAKCMVCHSDKLLDIPDEQKRKSNSKLKDIDE